VPYTLVGKELDVRLTKSAVEIFNNGERIASHARSIHAGRFSTLEEHMPIHQRDYVDQNSKYFLAEALKIGPWSVRFVEGVLEKRKYPQLGFRTCQGLLRLAKRYGPIRLEAACEKAVRMGGFAYRTLESLLLHNLDQLHHVTAKEQKIVHLNVRGAEYYCDTQEERDNADTSDVGQAESSQTERHA
jgi:transposase